MKKSAFVFALFYLLSVVGYGLELHYCLGQVTDVNVAWLGTSCSCDELYEVSAPCCDEKEFFVQVSDEHQANQASWLKVPIQTLITTELIEFSINQNDSTSHLSQVASSDPPKIISLFERHCARITYG